MLRSTTGICPPHNLRSARGLAATGLAAALSLSAPALAQSATSSDPDADAIIVTGSQVARPGFESPTPITSLDDSDLKRVSAANIADTLNQLPALKPSVTPSSVGNLSKLAGGNYLDLRGLGYLRTLTLIDGKRYVPTSPEGVVSINLIPQALVGGVDVVTGGASAAYGSDAVAGVVNFKLDHKLEGFKGSIQGGITDHNDYRNYLASGAFGTSFGGGRGHLLLGAEAAQNSGIDDLTARKWASNRTLINNPNFGTDPSEPYYIKANDAKTTFTAPGGLITSGILAGTQFAPDGSTLPFGYGTSVSDSTMDGGDGDALAAPYVMVTPTNRRSFYGGLSYELTNSLTAYASLLYATSKFKERSIPAFDTFTIQADNAYLAEPLQQALVDAGETSFTLGRSLEDYGVGGIEQKARTWQATGGLKGSLGGTWSFDASYAYGKTRTLTAFTGNIIRARRLLAIDAVRDPSTGSVVCRSTLADPGNGCVPINLFGVGAPSPAAINYMTGTSDRDWYQTQQVADLVVRGEPFSTWAGPVSLAVGAQWRRLEVDVKSDPDSAVPNTSYYRVGNTKPFSALEVVKEAFAEVVIPLAKDESWARNLDLNLAGRITDYRTSGTVETWKAGINYTLDDSIRFRATRSRDIRAPNINELFAVGQTLFYNINDTAVNRTYTVSTVTGGNPYLVPEKADTLTAGVVLTPTAIPGLNLSLDYYDIKVKGAIASLTAQSIVQRCNDGEAASCLLTPRGSDGLISTILLAPINFQQIVTSGFDFEAAYRMPMGEGALDARLMVNYISRLNLIGADGEKTKFAGSTDQPVLDGPGGTPRWKANANVTYSNDAYRLSLTGRYVGGGVVTRDDVTLDDNHVKGRFYLDLSGEVTLVTLATGKVSLFGVVTNALDQDPPFTGYQFVTARQLYDVVGRQYTAGLRFNF